MAGYSGTPLPKKLEIKEGAVGLRTAWPKKASSVVTDVTESVVRRSGLFIGLVDYKICAIDETWSGLKLARRRDSRRDETPRSRKK